jgi:hypothetical protein
MLQMLLLPPMLQMLLLPPLLPQHTACSTEMPHRLHRQRLQLNILLP